MHGPKKLYKWTQEARYNSDYEFKPGARGHDHVEEPPPGPGEPVPVLALPPAFGQHLETHTHTRTHTHTHTHVQILDLSRAGEAIGASMLPRMPACETESATRIGDSDR